MKHLILAQIIAICLFLSAQKVIAEELDLGWSSGLTNNVLDSFTGRNLFFHAAGIVSTPLIVSSGVDSQVRDTFRHSKNVAAFPGAVIASGVGALMTAGALYYSGNSSGNWETVGAAYVVGQASIITVTYVMLLKAVTGRAHPTNKWHLTSQEQSEQWQFGFMRAGATSYGWPSGHVSHTVAVTSALAHYYPQKNWLKWLGVGLSSYMVYTVVAHDTGQMHWFSDGVAGAFMGYAIGSTVGKNFRSRISGTSEKTAAVSLLPVVGSGYFGGIASLEF